MNDVVVCDKELNEVMDAETVAAITFNHTHGSMGSWDRPERYIMNAPPHRQDCGVTQVLRENIAVHNAAYEALTAEEFPEENNMNALVEHDGITRYAAMDDLPEVGDSELLYKVTSTGDLFVFRDNQYCAYNPYATPSEQIQQPREMIEDDSAYLPHGGTGPLAMIYNVHALRRDLTMKQIMGWNWLDMIPKGAASGIAQSDPSREMKLRSLYLRTSHKTLVEQFRTNLRYRGEFRPEYITALERLNIEVWHTDGFYGYRDGDFSTVFA